MKIVTKSAFAHLLFVELGVPTLPLLDVPREQLRDSLPVIPEPPCLPPGLFVLGSELLRYDRNTVYGL